MSFSLRRLPVAATLALAFLTLPAFAQGSGIAPNGNGMSIDPNGGQHSATAAVNPSGNGMSIDPNGGQQVASGISPNGNGMSIDPNG
jgi:hypothetical protein